METYSVTKDAPPTRKIDSWLQLLREMFVSLEYMSSDQSADVGLEAIVEHRTLANLGIRLVASTRQCLHRSPQRATDNEGQYFLVAMQVSGSGTVTQDDRRAVLQPGDFSLYDTTRPYILDFSGPFEQLVVSVPRNELTRQLPGVEKLMARHISGVKPMGCLLRHMVQGLPSAIDVSTTDTHSYVSAAVVDLIAANLRALEPSSGTSTTKLQRYHEGRIKSFIQENATDAELSVAGIAEALDMSISSVYRAFEDQHLTVAEMIWLERLNAARSALRDRAQASRTIKEIAFQSGFSDAAHFSRTFRQRYGVTPRQFREDGS